MNRKKRILFVGEASFLGTGFGQFWNEIIKRLFATQEFELAEIASYAYQNDPRNQQVPWTFFPVTPHPQNKEANQIYASDPENQFGKNIFSEVCLKWRPDLILDARDFWMNRFIMDSPLRNNFKIILEPTIDGEPQRSLWLDYYHTCDGILTYSEWAMDLIRSCARPKTNLITVASPGVDMDVFRPPIDKKEHKRKLGIDPESIIVGCFAKNMPVLMADMSLKPIQEVVIGDKVLNASGEEDIVEATHIFDKPDKDILEITVMGEPEPIILTEDHEMLSVPRNRLLRWVCATGQRVFWNPKNRDYDSKYDDQWVPEFIEPKELFVGDLLAFKIPKKIVDIDSINMLDYIEKPKNTNKINDNILINEDFLYLCGMYLANGSIGNSKDCSNHSIELSIDRNKIKIKNKIVQIVDKLFGLIAHIEHKNNVNTDSINVHNVYLARTFVSLMGKYADQKFIPDIFRWLPPEKQLSIVRGWQAGDGHLSDSDPTHPNTKRDIGRSINLNMLSFFRMCLLRNNIVASLNKRNMDKAQCFDNAKQQWVLIEKINEKRNEQFIHNGYLYCPIKKIQKSDYNYKLYDLTVKNQHSYQIYYKGVHNTVMRNQVRKKYYDLIEAFAKWIYKSKTKGHLGLANKAFLYLHTSYPDVGFDIGKAVREFNIGNKVLMTYICRNCQTVFPSFFQEELCHCRKCGKLTAHCPDANHGCPRNVLADIMKCFDLYMQPSVAEGWALPLADAQCCGTPTAATDYSAMKDHLKNPTSIPIEVGMYYRESVIETEQKRALPSQESMVNIFDKFIKLSYEKRCELSKRTRQWCEELVDVYGQETKLPRRSWERTATIWYNILKEFPIHDQNQTWLYPKTKLYQPPNLNSISWPINNYEFIKMVIEKIWNRSSMASKWIIDDWVRALNMGRRIIGHGAVPIDRNYVINHFLNELKKYNQLEIQRVNMLNNTQAKDNNQIQIMRI